MFTYDSIGTFDEFTLFRPIFITLLVMMVLVFITIVIPKWRAMYRSVFPILLMSAVGVIASAQLLFFDGVLIDELGLSGDPVPFFLVLFTGVFALLNPCIFLWKQH